MRHNVISIGLFLTVVAWIAVTPVCGQSVDAKSARELYDLVTKSNRLLFLGDSITAAGPYITFFETWLVAQKLERTPFVIDAGLPSETVSGLSEDGHAGGQFPRPDLAERLERVLALAKPDLVIACYGINCGIYEPFDQGRFERYQQGIKNLKSRVEKSGAQLILVTPPFYDDLKAPKSFAYNAVLDRYADWLLEQRQAGWKVIDLHGPMTREVATRRVADKQFTFQPDGVHPNDAGYWYVASQLIAALGDSQAASAESAIAMLKAKGIPAELLDLVRERVTLLRDSYVGTAGHKRPGIAKGLPTAEAEAKARELTAKINTLLQESK